MTRQHLSIVFAGLLVGGMACSASTQASGNDEPTTDATLSDTDDVADSGAAPKKKQKTKDSGVATTEACEAPAESKCAPPFSGSVIRGVVRFDPKQLDDSEVGNVVLFLRHSFALQDGEETIGGRLHAYKYLKNVNLGSGSVPFSIDLCELGTAMWSEENGAFNLVAILDANGDNNPDTTALGELPAQTPTVGEWSGMATVRVSCHAESPCVTIEADCNKGAECTTITPIKGIACETPSCPSDDAFCTK